MRKINLKMKIIDDSGITNIESVGNVVSNDNNFEIIQFVEPSNNGKEVYTICNIGNNSMVMSRKSDMSMRMIFAPKAETSCEITTKFGNMNAKIFTERYRCEKAKNGVNIYLKYSIIFAEQQVETRIIGINYLYK